MGFIGFDHIQLAIPKGAEEDARAFFVGLLGMVEIVKPPGFSASGCWFESGGVKLHVAVDREFVPAKQAHPALLVDDLTALERRLLDAGCRLAPGKPMAGYRRFFTHDPFGNRIEFMERDAASISDL